MTPCEHDYIRTSIISSTLSDTSYRNECKDCGWVEYVTESVVLGTLNPPPSRSFDKFKIPHDIPKDGERK